jgi:hypothetical protein
MTPVVNSSLTSISQFLFHLDVPHNALFPIASLARVVATLSLFYSNFYEQSYQSLVVEKDAVEQ